jgi:hypothetical protein
VELVRMIEGYLVAPLRAKATEELVAASRCFKNECSMLDHVDRDTLLEIYDDWVIGTDTRHPEYFDNPDDKQLVSVLRHGHRKYPPPELEYLEEEETHEANRHRWPRAMKDAFSESNRSMFQKRFGLDIWYSFVRLPCNGRYDEHFGLPQAAIAYLTLPNSVTSSRKWPENEEIEDPWTGEPRIVDAGHGEIGFGIPVEICKQPSAEELRKFSKALKFLKLKVFSHRSQNQEPALRLGSSNGDDECDAHDAKDSDELRESMSTVDSNGKDEKLNLFPRPMLLMHHEEH